MTRTMKYKRMGKTGLNGQPAGKKLHAHNIKFSLGVAWDEAFCFYYRDNLEFLEKLGAKLSGSVRFMINICQKIWTVFCSEAAIRSFHAKALEENKTIQEMRCRRQRRRYAYSGRVRRLSLSLEKLEDERETDMKWPVFSRKAIKREKFPFWIYYCENTGGQFIFKSRGEYQRS